jgi:hypothetical protein
LFVIPEGDLLLLLPLVVLMLVLALVLDGKYLASHQQLTTFSFKNSKKITCQIQKPLISNKTQEI